MTHPLGEGAAFRRDVRDASEATSAALDSVLFVDREALTPTQGATLAGVICHLREALTGLDALGKASGEPDNANGGAHG